LKSWGLDSSRHSDRILQSGAVMQNSEYGLNGKAKHYRSAWDGPFVFLFFPSRWFDKALCCREMACRSVVILIIGIYFITLGLAGEGMRYLSKSSQGFFFYLIAFLGAFFVIVLLLSENLKRKFRIYLHKIFSNRNMTTETSCFSL
jgi:hypothetical protein